MKIAEIAKRTTEFVVYVHDFYGPEGIYPMGATIRTICDATQTLLESVEDWKEIQFDSLDRERVRDIMIHEHGLVFPGEGHQSMFVNHYKCYKCGKTWTDTYECQVDDDCPHCGARHCTPEHSEDCPMRYQVVVGNIGTVTDTNNPVDARRDYGEYKRQSESGYGRAGGETVTLFKDGEIDLEHIGSNDIEDEDGLADNS